MSWAKLENEYRGISAIHNIIAVGATSSPASKHHVSEERWELEVRNQGGPVIVSEMECEVGVRKMGKFCEQSTVHKLAADSRVIGQIIWCASIRKKCFRLVTLEIQSSQPIFLSNVADDTHFVGQPGSPPSTECQESGVYFSNILCLYYFINTLWILSSKYLLILLYYMLMSWIF